MREPLPRGRVPLGGTIALMVAAAVALYLRLPRLAGFDNTWRRLSSGLADLPGDAAPRALLLDGPRRTVRRRLDLPAAAQQCGYETFFTLQLPRG